MAAVMHDDIQIDGLNGVVWRDDVQAIDLVVRKRFAAVPGVAVEIEEIA